MPASEFTEWLVIDEKFDPFGSVREDLRAGMIASPLLNIQLAKGSPRTKPTDWILDLRPVQPMTDAQMQKVFKALAEGYKRSKRPVQEQRSKKERRPPPTDRPNRRRRPQ